MLEAKKKFGIDVAVVSELWRHGSVVRSWLLDLTRAQGRRHTGGRQTACGRLRRGPLDGAGSGRFGHPHARDESGANDAFCLAGQR